MNKKRLIGCAVGLIMMLGLTLAIGDTEARHRQAANSVAGKLLPVKGSISGSIVNTQSDTNNDGQKGSLFSGGYKGTPGPFTFQAVVEHEFSGEGTCPNGNAGVILAMVPGTGHRVVRRDSTGDLIFFELTSMTQCFDPSTGIAFFEGTDNATGGTGRFAGATGSGTFSGTAKILFQDAAGNFFGEFSGTYEGTIITP